MIEHNRKNIIDLDESSDGDGGYNDQDSVDKFINKEVSSSDESESDKQRAKMKINIEMAKAAALTNAPIYDTYLTNSNTRSVRASNNNNDIRSPPLNMELVDYSSNDKYIQPSSKKDKHKSIQDDNGLKKPPSKQKKKRNSSRKLKVEE